jgi:hypothetical protein
MRLGKSPDDPPMAARSAVARTLQKIKYLGPKIIFQVHFCTRKPGGWSWKNQVTRPLPINQSIKKMEINM